MDLQRSPTEDITRGLETTAAKIRALARTGYERTEISKVLGIRYQHVRKVLVDAGVTSGLWREVEAARDPIVLDAARLPRGLTSWQVLLDAGFKFLGEWTLDAKSAIRLDAKAPTEPGVYAFAANDTVVYVGLTNNGLRARLDGYRVGHKGQKTNARVKGLITDALGGGQRIKVFVATPPPLSWNGLPVNTAAGLEAGLIQMMRPAWNILGLA